jgi:N-acetylglutamate synthase
MNAWPAMQSLHYDGWVLRCAEGYTKRANSVYPLYPSQLDVDEKIEFCESFYRDRGLPTVFKLTRASAPANLDAFLEKRGYHMDSLTSVQLLDLSAEEYETTGGVDLTSTDSEIWHAAFAHMNNVSPDQQATHEHILRAILPDKCYASLSVDGHIIGCGLGALQSGYLGIFDIVIAPNHRGQGNGTRLMQALLAWGQGHGAHTSYLQVMSNNGSALGLYEKLAFQEKYQYWYRIG